ncbi:hypothetical protein ECG_01633 [Echinococcus granulosus]|nr:hypothetical protein ECG_01633 [Echinococcus granulosus]
MKLVVLNHPLPISLFPIMSDAFAALSIFLTNKYFGDNAMTIVRCLQIHGSVTLKMLERILAGRLSPISDTNVMQSRLSLLWTRI